MKKLNKSTVKLFVLALFVPYVSFSQIDENIVELPSKDGKVVYESIIENPTLTKATLYGASKKWIADTFISAKAITQSEDYNTGQIIGKFYNDLEIYKNDKSIIGRKFDTQCSIQIDVKDGKCRIRFYDIIWLYPSKEFVTFRKPIDEFLNASEEKKYSKWFSKQKVNSQYNVLIESYKKAITSAQSDNF